MTIAEQLQQIDLFREVELTDLEALVTRMKPEAYPPQQILFHIGDPGDTMYIILSGRIRIYMYDKNGEEITLTFYGKNEIFGELSPIDQRPRSASAAAAEPLEVLSLARQDFLDFLNERPQIGLAMMRSLSQRLRNTTAYLEAARPSRFVKPAEPRGEEFRRPAEPEIADILERAGSEDRDERVAVPKTVEFRHRSESPTEAEKPSDTTPDKPEAPVDPPKESGMGMGIFDRIAAAANDREEQSGDDDTQEETQSKEDNDLS